MGLDYRTVAAAVDTTAIDAAILDNSLSIQKGLFTVQSQITAGLIPLSNMAIDALNSVSGINEALSLYSWDSVNKRISAPVYTAALLGEYKFSDNLLDTSTTASNGTGVNVAYAASQIGRGLSLAGNGYVQMNGNAVVKNQFSNRGTFAFSFWFKTSSQADQDILRFDKVNSPRVCVIIRSRKLLFLRADSAGASDSFSSDNSYDDNAWHHIVAMYDGTTMSLIIDNGAAKTLGSTRNCEVPDYMSFGAEFSQAGIFNYFTGSLDQLRVYSRTLTALEIRALYVEQTTASGYVTWNAVTADEVPTKAYVTADETLNSGAVSYTMSRNGGTNNTAVVKDTLTTISGQPSGTSMVLKAALTLDATINAIGEGWK